VRQAREHGSQHRADDRAFLLGDDEPQVLVRQREVEGVGRRGALGGYVARRKVYVRAQRVGGPR
jgi:hypothetical protein